MAYSSATPALIVAIIAIIIAIVALVLAVILFTRKKAGNLNIINGTTSDTSMSGAAGNYYIASGINQIAVNKPSGNPTGGLFVISNSSGTSPLVITPGTGLPTISGSNIIPSGSTSQFVWVAENTIQNVTSG